jgi:predicted nucleic acid-binding protein
MRSAARADVQHPDATRALLPGICRPRGKTGESPLISSLVHYEFQQAVWFKVWLHAQSQPLGLSDTAAQSVLAAFELDVEHGPWVVAVPEWESVVARVERLALVHPPRYGARAMDILHLAFALRLGVTELLTFDESQRQVALAEGLAVGPKTPGAQHPSILPVDWLQPEGQQLYCCRGIYQCNGL